MKFLAILSLPLLLGAAESRHWQDFVNFKKTGGAPVISSAASLSGA